MVPTSAWSFAVNRCVAERRICVEPQPRTMFSGLTPSFFAVASMRSPPLEEYRPGVRPPSPNAARDPKLDPGDAEAIVLALELGASAILVDEKTGRRTAIAQRLAVLGTLTVLELAADRELLVLSVALGALQSTTFHCTQALIDDALQRHAGKKRI